MNLKKSSILVIVGIIYSLLLKISILLYPGIFSHVFTSQISYFFSILTNIAIILFGFYFIKEVIGQNRIHFKLTVLATMIGPAFFILIHLKDIIRLSPKLSLKLYDFSPYLYNVILTGNSRPSTQLILWLSSIFICYFFYTLHNQLNGNYNVLKKATFLVLISSALNVLHRTFAFITYLFFPNSSLITSTPTVLLLLSFSIFLLLSFTLLIFFWRLYKIKKYTNLIT
jgi:hypothetical protein